MSFVFKIIDAKDIENVVPLVFKLNSSKIAVDVLKQRFREMVKQNYECACIFEEDKIIGVTGLWYCTRHYSGKSVEVDHVYIDDGYRGKNLGKQFFKWIYDYTKTKGCETIELNTYVQNYPSHKFYYNEEFEILGYHFLKKL
ncbi:MAG TPA: GNAT family N-acetyltransferase [Flavobacteriaceae bacterium]|nr:GNAT family N-acetyltransferase [Flavobacteriaceae bacterium]